MQGRPQPELRYHVRNGLFRGDPLASHKSRSTGVQPGKCYNTQANVYVPCCLEKGLRVCTDSNTPPQRVSSETLLALSSMHRSARHANVLASAAAAATQPHSTSEAERCYPLLAHRIPSCGLLPPLQPVLNPTSQPVVAAESLEWDRCVPCFRNAARHSVHLVAGHRRAKPPD